MKDINELKKEYIEIYNKCISREGAKELLEYLQKSDFFVAPASIHGYLSVREHCRECRKDSGL